MPITDSIQSNKQHAVPQNIMDVEFKLVGDLTMRQFAYLCVFGGAAYLMSVLPTGVFKLPLMAIFALLGLGLAFVPIQERGLDQWIVNFMKAVYSPTQRLWKKEATIPSAFLHDNLAVVRQELITLAPTSSRRHLEEYLRYQEGVSKVVDPLDIPESAYALKVRDLYEAYPVSAGLAPTSTTVIDEPYTVIPSEPTGGQPQEVEEQPTEQVEQPVQVQEVPPVAGMPSMVPSPVPSVVPSAPPSAAQPQFVVQPTQPKVQASQVQQVPQMQQAQAPVPQVPQAAPMPVPPVAPVQQRAPSPQVPPPVWKPKPHTELHIVTRHGRDSRVTGMLSPMTPDMHSGRRFTNFSPTGGELMLPIRGERVVQNLGTSVPEENERQKAAQLQDLLNRIKEDEGMKRATGNRPTVPLTQIAKKVVETVTAPAPSPESAGSQKFDKEANELLERLKQQSALLDEKMKQPVPSPSSRDTFRVESRTQELEAEKLKSSQDYEALSRQIAELQNKLKEKDVALQSAQEAQSQQAQQPKSAGQPRTYLPPLTQKANIVSGVVKDPTGKNLENILMMIKNSRGETVRAFKSNRLGQFVLSTPLTNGFYTLEVSSVNDMKLTFDIISFEAKGEVLPPIEVLGR